jgi:acyl-CoA synthetase (NDP forming)
VTPGGGSSVNATDLLSFNNMQVPELTKESQFKLSEILPKENVNIKNPVDLGALGFVLEVFLSCIEVVMRDPSVDIILIPLWPHFMYNYVYSKMLKVLQEQDKPFAFCLPSIADSLDLAKKFASVQKLLHKQRALYFFSLRDAARSISLLCDYVDYLKSRSYMN